MSEQWCYSKGGQRHGPITAERLKELAATREISPADLVWKEGMSQGVEARKVKGLFPEASDSEPPPLPPPLPRTKAGQSPSKATVPAATTGLANAKSMLNRHSTKARALLRHLLANIRDAGHLTAKMAQRTWLKETQLPKLYEALGRHLHTSGTYHSAFPDAHEKINQLLAEMSEAEQAAPSVAAAEGMAAKAKAVGATAKHKAAVQLLKHRLAGQMAELGKVAFARDGEKSGPPELVRPIAATLAQVVQLDTQIASLSTSSWGRVITPRHIMIGGTVIVALLIVSAFQLFAPKHEAVSRSESQGTADSQFGQRRIGTSPETVSMAGLGTGDLPSDISGHKSWPDLPLMQMPLRLSEEKKGYEDTPHVFFSPAGGFVLVVYIYHDKQDVRLWHVATGEQRTAKSPDCDYFLCRSAKLPPLCSAKLPCYLERRRGLPSSK